MELKKVKKTVFEVNYHDLDNFISYHMGFDESYKIIAYEELQNDTTKTYDIDGRLDKYDSKAIEGMLQAKKPDHFSTVVMLNHLCQKGLLEPGQYNIEIFW